MGKTVIWLYLKTFAFVAWMEKINNVRAMNNARSVTPTVVVTKCRATIVSICFHITQNFYKQANGKYLASRQMASTVKTHQYINCSCASKGRLFYFENFIMS